MLAYTMPERFDGWIK